MNPKKKLLERASYNWSKNSIRLILTPSDTAKSTLLYLQEAGYFETLPPYFTERENLDSYLVLYTLSGSGTLNYEDNTYECTAGDCFYIDCSKHHYYATDKAAGSASSASSSSGSFSWNFLWFHFYGNNAGGYYKLFSKSSAPILHLLEGSKRAELEDTMRELIRLQTPKIFSTELRTSDLIGHILTELLISIQMNPQQTIELPDYIEQIAKYIDRNFTETITLDMLSKLVHRNKYQIIKDFKKNIGVTPNEYIIISRISYAKELLKYSDLSVNEIADEVGIDGVTHFINLFKARENMTPLHYRKQWH